MKYVEENIVRVKLFYIFFERLNKMGNIFSDKIKFITDKYREIVYSNRSKSKSEILVQEKFLEYNDYLDNIIFSIDDQNSTVDSVKFKGIILFIKFIIDEIKLDRDPKKNKKPWNKDYEFYKNYFIYSSDNPLFNTLFTKYSKLDKNYIIVKYILINKF